MAERKPWQPRLKNAPLFNPFEPSTEWTAQIGADDRIEIEEEHEAAENEAPVAPATKSDPP